MIRSIEFDRGEHLDATAVLLQASGLEAWKVHTFTHFRRHAG